MAKLTLTDIAAGYGLVGTINANNALLETALENTLSRDGTTPNTMSADLDMNSQQITNLPTPTANSHGASKLYVDTLIAAVQSAGDFSAALSYDFTNTIDFSGVVVMDQTLDVAGLATFTGGVRFADSAGTDYLNSSHDGTDLLWAFTQTTDWQITGAANVMFLESPPIYIYGDVTNGNANDFVVFNLTTSQFLIQTGGSDLGAVDIKLSPNEQVYINGNLSLFEATAAPADTAGYGQLWVKNDAPNTLWFTDDAGTDYQVSGGGLASTWSAVLSANDQITSDSTLTAISDFTYTIPVANKNYAYEAWIYVSQVSAVPDFKYTLVASNTLQSSLGSYSLTDSGGTQAGDVQALTATAAVAMAATQNILHIQGTFKANATTPGTLQFQFAQNTSDANPVTVIAGSWVKVTPLD
jgi:hypothetical protein